jgi:antitoxin (DNA-binding transcriptional repressor) of toxin-antitoxin stability system
MKQMTVGDFKAHFSSVLEEVMQGEEIQILYGRLKKPVACLTKLAEKSKRKKRPLGSYEGKATYWEDESFEFTPEMLFDDMNDLL